MHPVAMDQPGLSSSERRQALTDLFRREFRGVYGFVLARTGSSAIAEEITSDTFAEAARVARSDTRDLSAGWLLTVARRRLIDHWRRAERHRRRIQRLQLQRPGDEDRSSDIEDDRVLEALASLPLRQRAALTLRYVDEFSVDEVAEALDVTYKAAESLLSRARQGFKAAMEASHG